MKAAEIPWNSIKTCWWGDRGFPFGFPCQVKDVLTLLLSKFGILFFFCLFQAVACSCWHKPHFSDRRSFSTSKNYLPFPVIKTQLSPWTKRSCWIPCSSSHPWEAFAGFEVFFKWFCCKIFLGPGKMKMQSELRDLICIWVEELLLCCLSCAIYILWTDLMHTWSCARLAKSQVGFSFPSSRFLFSVFNSDFLIAPKKPGLMWCGEVCKNLFKSI